jgi:hypothetical protein
MVTGAELAASMVSQPIEPHRGRPASDWLVADAVWRAARQATLRRPDSDVATFWAGGPGNERGRGPGARLRCGRGGEAVGQPGRPRSWATSVMISPVGSSSDAKLAALRLQVLVGSLELDVLLAQPPQLSSSTLDSRLSRSPRSALRWRIPRAADAAYTDAEGVRRSIEEAVDHTAANPRQQHERAARWSVRRGSEQR